MFSFKTFWIPKCCSCRMRLWSGRVWKNSSMLTLALLSSVFLVFTLCCYWLFLSFRLFFFKICYDDRLRVIVRLSISTPILSNIQGCCSFSRCPPTVRSFVFSVIWSNRFYKGDFCQAHYASMMNRNHSTSILRRCVFLSSCRHKSSFSCL